MKFYAQINVMPLKALLDPQGKAVLNSAVRNGFESLRNVRIGKHIDVEIDADSKDEANKKIDEFCSKVLVNPIIESYEFSIEELK
ncbi:MAG: phosphoribosylformylglycinamidine synthase subunit PurS [Bacteroidales bacterium]|nr:phosphoribosylformylglycinamidine synthase subunit PurS [Bacteroidales bacterium]